jgi:hypothetical protein
MIAGTTTACFRAVRAETRGGGQTGAVGSLGPARRDGIAPHEAVEAIGSDSTAARSKTDAPSESAQHGEDTLGGVNARDEANEPRRSRVFPAQQLSQRSREIRCRATASPLPLRAVRHSSC